MAGREPALKSIYLKDVQGAALALLVVLLNYRVTV